MSGVCLRDGEEKRLLVNYCVEMFGGCWGKGYLYNKVLKCLEILMKRVTYSLGITILGSL